MHTEAAVFLRARAGVSLIEALAALTLSSLVITLLIGTCIAQMKLARATAQRAVTNDAVRTTIMVLAGEARRMTVADVRAVSAESVAIRAFRGTALVCGITPTGVLVRYIGDRLPDQSKDSILMLDPPAAPLADALIESHAAPGQCTAAPGEEVFEWRLASGAAQGPALLLFESGSYHIGGRAFRYRIGAAGRQPLTAEVLAPESRFNGVSERALRFDVDAGGVVASRAAPFSRAVPP